MASISKGITLAYGTKDGTSYTDLTNLQEIPSIGGTAESIEITTLADAAHMYTNGLLNYGDSLTFKFLYEKEQFQLLNSLGEGTNNEQGWRITLPDGLKCSFNGVPSVQFDGVGINAALTYTLAIKPTSEMLWS